MEHCQFIWLDENSEYCKQVAELEKQIFSDAWREKAILDTLNNPQAKILVAMVGEIVAGYVTVYYVLDECEIARIAVLPNMRRKRIAHQLMGQLITWCKEKEICRILLDVRESNKGAIAYYEHEEFVTDGVRKNFYDAPKEHAVLMSKDLNGTTKDLEE